MREPRSRSDVVSFLHEVRRTTQSNRELLEQLDALRGAAARRLNLARQNEPPSLEVLVEELQVRDEELRATVDELRTQLETVRQAATVLERERSKYVDLFEHAPDAYVVTDLAGVLEEANVAAGALFRAETSFLRGRLLISFVARGDTEAFRSLLRRVQTLDQATPRDTLRAALRMRPRGQPVFMASVHVGILSAPNGRPLALRWVLRRLDADDARENNHGTLADLARAMGPDLHGALVPLIEWVRCLREWDVRDEEERRKALSWIERSAQAQQAKLEELAELARVHRETPAAEVVDVIEAVQQAAGADGQWSRVAVRCEANPGPAHVLASGLPRALDLFLQRALESTPDHVDIELQVQAHAGEVRVTITAPEGARIPDGWSTRTAIATRIVDRCQGRVVSIGGGPSVSLRLPRLPPSAPASVGARTPS